MRINQPAPGDRGNQPKEITMHIEDKIEAIAGPHNTTDAGSDPGAKHQEELNVFKSQKW